MTAMATEEELFCAVRDVVALTSEFEGASIEEKLRQFGLDPEAVKKVLAERWETYGPQFDPARPELIFAQAATEFLLVGIKLDGAREGDDG